VVSINEVASGFQLAQLDKIF